VLRCPACGASAFDPLLEFCEECGYEPDEEDEGEEDDNGVDEEGAIP
jgi:uncharacterized OB-fold protein